ncbi:MAG: peptidoglycan DD-metalloendopeptidase family protein [Hyphomicrobiaceae bacterium]|nr:peptidoglycan DD-metalloendopeptidase family protein [Hyphomicrobiaceae bacterium]
MRRTDLPLLLLLAATPAVDLRAEDTTPRKLDEVERAIAAERERLVEATRRADGLAREVTEVRAEQIQAARAAQAHGIEVQRLDDRLVELAEEEKTMSSALDRRRQELADVAAALLRRARVPPEALLALPLSPRETVQGAILLNAARPEIERQTESLAGDLARLADTRARIHDERKHRESAVAALAVEENRLDRLLKRKAALQQRAEGEAERVARRMQELTASARDLKDLIDRLEAERRAREEEQVRVLSALRPLPKPTAPAMELAQPAPSVATPPFAMTLPPPAELARPFAEARGLMALPVAGRLVQRFGEPDDQAQPAKGMIYESRTGAAVVAPYDGRILFAGPFRGYGLILIIEHGEGYHSLLSGLGRIDGGVGQWVLAGEPVGAMVQATEGNPRLYLELRRQGHPINPQPWLAAGTGKVNG